MIDKIIYTTVSIFTFLFPIFFLTITPDPYEYNKMALLVVASLVLLLLFSLKIAVSKKISVKAGSFGPLLIFLAGIFLISTLIQSPNLVITLTTPLSTTTIIAGAFLYFLLINLIDNKMKKLLSNILIAGAVLIALYIVLLYVGILPRSFFTPAGTTLTTTMYLLIIAVFLLAKIIVGLPRKTVGETDNNPKDLTAQLEKEIYEAMFDGHKSDGSLPTTSVRSSSPAILVHVFSSDLLYYLLSFLFILGAVILAAIHLLTDQQPFILPLSFGWGIFLEIVKSFKSLLLGVGPANFQTAYTMTKPIGINATHYWNVIFTSSSSFFLNIATESGVLAAFFYWLIAFKTIRIFSSASGRRKSTTGNQLPYIITLLFALGIQAILPSGMSVVVLTFILLSFASQNTHILELDTSRLKGLNYLFVLPPIVLAISTFYFGGRAYLAEVKFKKSLDALLNNEAGKAYALQGLSKKLNPFIDRYHVAFSRTSLAIANSLASKGKLTEEDRQNIPKLVQQAINEARIAVVLHRTNTNNWDNLANTYTYLLNFAQGSDEWAIKSHKQKIALDPFNPSSRFALGKLYLDLKNYDDAEKYLKEAISLKSDFANPHYYLSRLYRETNKYQEAYQELQTTKALVKPDSKDLERVENELAELENLLPPNQAAPSTEPEIRKGQSQSLESAESSPSALENLPTPRPIISLAEPLIPEEWQINK